MFEDGSSNKGEQLKVKLYQNLNVFQPFSHVPRGNMGIRSKGLSIVK